MLFLLHQWLSGFGEHIPAANLLKYLTFRSGMAMVTGYLVAVGMGSRFIAWMKAKQGKGQPIRTDGIARHVTEKAGTPTGQQRSLGVETMRPDCARSLAWRRASLVHSCRIVLLRSARRNVGCGFCGKR